VGNVGQRRLKMDWEFNIGDYVRIQPYGELFEVVEIHQNSQRLSLHYHGKKYGFEVPFSEVIEQYCLQRRRQQEVGK